MIGRGGDGGRGGGLRGTLSTLWGFRAVMDMAAVITQRLLLPTLPHLCPAKKCLRSAGRRPTTSEECRVWRRAGLAREDTNTKTPEEKWF